MFGDIYDCCESFLRCCSNLISKLSVACILQFGLHSISKGLEKTDNHLSILMSHNAFIEISSSDSELEEIEPAGRRLPSSFSASGSSSRTTDYAGKSRKVPSPRRAHASNGSSPNFNHHQKVLEKFHPSSSNDMRAPTRQVPRADGSMYSQKGNVSQHPNINSLIANNSVTDYEKISSQQALRRTLPLSMQAHNPAVDRGFVRDPLIRGIRGTDEHMYNRFSPYGKSSSTSQFSSSSEPPYVPGIGEERGNESDERLIYQAALEDLNQPKLETNLPDGLLSVSLLRHQKIALAWMLQKETRSLHCLGGILADDQGLGKTISMIALIQMQRSLQTKSKPEHMENNKTEALNLDDEDDNGGCGIDKVNKTEESDLRSTPEASTSAQTFKKKRPAAGTLVVCPASVLRQWARELDEKVAEEAKLSVLLYHGGSRTKNPEELASYDVVLTTYAIVTNECPKQPLVDEDEVDEKNVEKYGLSSDFSINKKRKKPSNAGKKGKKGRKGFDCSSFDCGSGPLARVGWHRVILDEAQTIKNHRTQVARACCSLRAKRRWCLSGTPIQNAIDDLYSYFRFLKYDPYAVYKSFLNTIKVPISRNSLQGYKKLQAVLRAIMLRRTKGTMIDGQPIINLPPKTINLSKVEFSSEERAFYTKLESDSRSQFKAYAAAGTVNQNYANILLMLLRLRQACDHPLLVKGFDSDSVGKESVDMASTLSRDMLIHLLNVLEDSEAICRVCNDILENPVVTMCGHVFCFQCVSEHMTGDDSMCPATECKKQVGPDVIFSESTLISCLSKDLDGGQTSSQLIEKPPAVVQNEYTSSKVRAVIELLQSHCKVPYMEQHDLTECSKGSSLKIENQDSSSSLKIENQDSSYSSINVVKRTTVVSNSPNDGPIKAIIFSQWTKMLDLVENAMNEYCIQYRRLDGTMTLAARDRAVKEFNTDPEVTVMLMSLKAGNLGLNMVSACHVILLDLWWNPTTEDQAVDRAHRIGQTRPVTVTRLTIKDTVEDRILALQDEKRKMVASAFGEDNSGGSAARLTVEDLRYLFMV